MKNLSLLQKNKIAQASFTDLLKWKTIGGLSYLKIGEILKKFKEEKLYRYLGSGSPEYESFENFLEMPEINMQLRKAYYLIQIYSTFVEALKFKPEELSSISWTSLRSLLPSINTENSKELVEKAKNLRRNDLEIEMAQYKRGIGLEELQACQHKEVEEIRFFRCLDCRERFKNLPKGSKIISKVEPKNKNIIK